MDKTHLTGGERVYLLLKPSSLPIEGLFMSLFGTYIDWKF